MEWHHGQCWEDTQVQNGEVGDYITIVHKDSESEDWYLGSVTDEERRELQARSPFSKRAGYAWLRYTPMEPTRIGRRTLWRWSIAGPYHSYGWPRGGGQTIRFRPAAEGDG
jgi:alpha-glucosidase